MTGKITAQRGTLHGALLGRATLVGGAIIPKGRLFARVAIPQSAEIDIYDGEYEVTPQTNGQTLETAGKRMAEDVQINAIPFFDVSNTAGGSTVYIGSEIN